MSSSQTTVDYILDQISLAGNVSARKMFGEYGVYCDGKIVALICDEQLFVKPTGAGRTYLGEPEMGCPYPGAKPYYLLGGDRWDDRDWLSELIRITAAELPQPVKKKK